MNAKQLRKIIEHQKAKCFAENKREDGKCYGLYDPSPMQGNIAFKCMTCPYLSIYE